MLRQNILLLFMAVLITLTIFPLGVTANYNHYYRTDLDNGSWNSFQTGITSTYLQDVTTGQSTYNRDFETDFSVSNGECENGWCNTDVSSVFARSGTYKSQGSYGGTIINPSGAGAVITSPIEIITDSNVFLWYRCGGVGCSGVASFGYVNDENTYKAVVSMEQTEGKYISYEVPKDADDSFNGNIRFAFVGNSSGTNTVSVDDIRIIKNNTGTYRANYTPAYCSTLSSCSNIKQHIPDVSRGEPYFVISYLTGAICGYRIGQEASAFATAGTGNFFDDFNGYLTEGTNGMYYMPITTPVLTNDYRDVNIEVYCLKAPLQKAFFDTVRLYKYGNIENGNFDSTIDVVNGSCQNGWCNTDASTHFTTTTTNAQDGENAARILLPSGAGAYIRSLEDIGGETVSFYYKCGGAGCTSSTWGYRDDANTYTAVGTMAQVGQWTYVSYTVPAGSYRLTIYGHGAAASNIYLDNVSFSGAKQTSTLTIGNNLETNHGIKGETYTFTSDYKNEFGNVITGADCNININTTVNAATFNPTTQLYELEKVFDTDGTYAITHECESSDFTAQEESYTATIVTPASSIVTFTPIENIASYSLSNFTNEVSINIQESAGYFTFSVVAQESNYDLNFSWSNSNINSKQYYVYTSSDGSTWVLNESLTYGTSSSYNDPVQKIRSNTKNNYEFKDNFTSGVKKYYKVYFRDVAVYWGNITGSADWVNVDPTTTYTDQNNATWDVFSDSNYSNIQSYTKKKYPYLTSTDLNTSFEFQFTAYASTQTTIKVGYRVGTTDTTVDVPISTGTNRYSVPVDPASTDAYLLIESTATTSATVYMRDYAIIPHAYFTGRLELLEEDNSLLGALSRANVSYTVLQEGVPFKIRTSAYDLEGDLKTLKVEALLGATVVKTYSFGLTDATYAERKFTWFETLDGVVDLNGWYGDPIDFRDLTIRATLINTSDESVSEQSSTVKLLQYPYFMDDINPQLYLLNAKVGENPKFSLNLEMNDPDNFLGFKLFIYDADHSRADPNYSDTVFNSDLGCSFYCQKTILVEDWVWEDEKRYIVEWLALVNTENEHYENDLTLKRYVFTPTYRELETARIFQVYERTDNTYRADEKIPLVLQLRDVPYKDLSKEMSVYITTTISDTVDGEGRKFNQTKFNPIKHIYDEVTGYNYYYWNNIFYNDNGSLVSDTNYIKFTAWINDKTQGHAIIDLPHPTLANKCQNDTYGDKFLFGWLGMNASEVFSASQRALFGCTEFTDAVVEIDDAQEERILIDEDHTVTGGQNHSLVCLNIDNNSNFVNNLEQDILCMIWYKRSQQDIDSFHFYVGNDFSDYAEDELKGQYLSFSIPAEMIMFNDPVMMQQALNAEYQTDSIDTIGEIAFYAIDDIFSGIANPLTDVINGVGTATGLITNYNFDLNWDNTFDPAYVDGVFFIKINGLKVVNQYDYSRQFPILETQNPKYFSKFLIQNGSSPPENKTTVTVYASDMNPVFSEKLLSNLVIFEKPSAAIVTPQQQADGNITQTVVPTRLKFNVSADMESNNNSSYSRISLPLTFTYIVPDNTGFIYSLLDVGGEFLTNPIAAGLKYWFWFVLIIVFLLVVATLYQKFKSGGNVIVNNKGSG